ncbi:hypothetical protein ACFXAW_38015 [Streptomyces sp. NPDC059445]
MTATVPAAIAERRPVLQVVRVVPGLTGGAGLPGAGGRRLG